jgi:hypothetical protein
VRRFPPAHHCGGRQRAVRAIPTFELVLPHHRASGIGGLSPHTGLDSPSMI